LKSETSTCQLLELEGKKIAMPCETTTPVIKSSIKASLDNNAELLKTIIEKLQSIETAITREREDCRSTADVYKQSRIERQVEITDTDRQARIERQNEITDADSMRVNQDENPDRNIKSEEEETVVPTINTKSEDELANSDIAKSSTKEYNASEIENVQIQDTAAEVGSKKTKVPVKPGDFLSPTEDDYVRTEERFILIKDGSCNLQVDTKLRLVKPGRRRARVDGRYRRAQEFQSLASYGRYVSTKVKPNTRVRMRRSDSWWYGLEHQEEGKVLKVKDKWVLAEWSLGNKVKVFCEDLEMVNEPEETIL